MPNARIYIPPRRRDSGHPTLIRAFLVALAGIALAYSCQMALICAGGAS